MKRIPYILSAAMLLASCSNQPRSHQQQQASEQLRTVPFTNGIPVRIEFEKGKHYYHPLIVFWVEDTLGNYIQTLYASQSIATGVFRFGEHEQGKWVPGERRRPAALPYWGHRRGFQSPDGLFLPTPENPLPDAITGATPRNNFEILTFVPENLTRYRVMMEVNQTWDWNNYWHNNKFPGDEEYQTSCQPALVYMAQVNTLSSSKEFDFKVIGHSHPSGSSGELFPDVSTFTTALEIASRVTITIN